MQLAAKLKVYTVSFVAVPPRRATIPHSPSHFCVSVYILHAYRHYMLNHRSIVTKYFTYVDWTYDRCEGTMASRSDDDMTLGPYQLSTLGPYQLSASLHPQAMASAVISWLH